MNVCVLGWYGTETMGDRAILDGVFKILDYCYDIDLIALGSVTPFFTEKTVKEDFDYYFTNHTIKIEIFDEKKWSDIKKQINKTDFLIMGGGPILDINDIYMILKSFKYAKKNNKKTALVGCGYGPMHGKRFAAIAKNLLQITDVCIFRDYLSMERAKAIRSDVFYLPDPAILSMLYYRDKYERKEDNYIAVNFRYGVTENPNIKESLSRLLDFLAKNVDEVKLIPMHTFFKGGDDRAVYSEFYVDGLPENVKILNEPVGLYELYEIYSNAMACIGMRYHAIVMQTILNGNNYIYDYTEGGVGKVSGFLYEVGKPDFYKMRYQNIYVDDIDVDNCIHMILLKEKYHDNYDKRKILSEYRDILIKYEKK